jgi:hypothetical protein
MYKSPFATTDESLELGLGEAEGEAEQEATLEAELATELLEISSEAELDRFLGKLASSVMKGASAFVKSPIGKALGGVLKNVAKTALPAVGGALGSMVLPGAGTAIGAKLGSLAGGLLEAGEAEAMGEAEAEYEAAQRYVRFARAAWGNAASAPSHLPPRAVARAASVSAARRYAPTLLRGDGMSPWRRRRGGYRRYGGPAYGGPGPRYAWFSDGRGDGGRDGGSDGWDGGADGGSDGWDGGADGWDGGPYEISGETSAPQGRWVRDRRGRVVLLGI